MLESIVQQNQGDQPDGKPISFPGSSKWHIIIMLVIIIMIILSYYYQKQFYCQFSDFRSTIKLTKIQKRSQWMSNIVIIEIVVNNNNISNNNNNNNNTVDSW